MPQSVGVNVQNNFVKGLITESNQLSFPENGSTDTDNCLYSLVGDVSRRGGMNQELNGTTASITRIGQAMSSYVWNNAGGDGSSKLLVKQVGNTLHFWSISGATVSSPITQHKLTDVITISDYLVYGSTFDFTKECQYSDGKGYLFVYHPNCDPFYIVFNPVTLSLTPRNHQSSNQRFRRGLRTWRSG